MSEVAKTCVYTIVLSSRLKAAYRRSGQATFEEGRRWVTAKRWLAAARDAGFRVPVIFAAAEDTTNLIYYGWLEEVVLAPRGARPATKYRVSGLVSLGRRPPRKTSLLVERTGRHISAEHRRPYVLCRTPEFLQAGRGLRAVKKPSARRL